MILLPRVLGYVLWFRVGDLNHNIVLHFLLHCCIGPCFHHSEPDVAIRNVQLLFRRTVNARTNP